MASSGAMATISSFNLPISWLLTRQTIAASSWNMRSRDRHCNWRARRAI